MPQLTAQHCDKEVPAMDFVNETPHSLINISRKLRIVKIIQLICQLRRQHAEKLRQYPTRHWQR